MQHYSPTLKATILEIVDNQLREDSPPEVKKTFERLIAKEMSKNKAKEMIGTILSYEISTVLKSQKPFDQARYVAALQKLPKVVGEDEYAALSSASE